MTTQESTLTATVDLAVCKGHGRCYMTAPEIFDCDDDGYPVVVAPAATAAAQESLQRAIQNCPEQAISASEA